MKGFPKMHVSLYVANIEKTVKFYDVFFGQPADKIKAGYAKYILASPHLIISFVENEPQVNQRFGHLGFQVESKEDMLQRLDRATSAGLKTREEMGTACCYAIQDKFWVSDPDGHQWEIYFFHEDAEFNDPHYANDTDEACCMPTGEFIEKTKMDLSKIGQEPCCNPQTGCC